MQIGYFLFCDFASQLWSDFDLLSLPQWLARRRSGRVRLLQARARERMALRRRERIMQPLSDPRPRGQLGGTEQPLSGQRVDKIIRRPNVQRWSRRVRSGEFEVQQLQCPIELRARVIHHARPTQCICS